MEVIFGYVLCRKKLFSAIHYFVHLNLAISLLLGYIAFVTGIQFGTHNEQPVPSNMVFIKMENLLSKSHASK